MTDIRLLYNYVNKEKLPVLIRIRGINISITDIESFEIM